jgi:hypothetical protein
VPYAPVVSSFWSPQIFIPASLYARRPFTSDNRNIQSRVWSVAVQCGYFHIEFVQMVAFFRFGVLLTYKQVRDALYRLRDRNPITHHGFGWYKVG